MDIFFDNAEHPCRPDTARSLSPINFFWRSRMLSDGRLSSRGWRCWCHTPHHTWPEASVPGGTVSVSVRLLACWSSTQAKDFRFLRSRVSNFSSSLYYRLVDAVEHSRFFHSQFVWVTEESIMFWRALSLWYAFHYLWWPYVILQICSLLLTRHSNKVTAGNKQSICKLLFAAQPTTLQEVNKILWRIQQATSRDTWRHSIMTPLWRCFRVYATLVFIDVIVIVARLHLCSRVP